MQEYKIPSGSRHGVTYTVTEEGGAWDCDCPAGQMRKTCIHKRKAQHTQEHGFEMSVNENLVEMVRGKGGRAALNTPLLIGERVALYIEGDVVGVEEEDQHDGTYDRIAKVRAIFVEKRNYESNK